MRDLEYQYVERTPGIGAIRRLENPPKTPALATLLRHHDETSGGISDAQTYQRDEFDYLIAFYGLVELACILGVIEGRLPAVFKKRALKHLTNSAVQKYYEVNYPLVLPQLLVRRLDGRSDLRARCSRSIGWGAFERVRLLGYQIDTSDEEMDRFLWLLDGGSIGRYDINDWLEIFDRPKELVRRLTRKEDDRDFLDDALAGFGRFLHFARGMVRLLEDVDDRIAQSALWHQHGYWFNAFDGHVGQKVRSVLPLIADRVATHRGVRAAKTNDETLQAIGMLCSGRFAWRLREIAGGVAEEDPRSDSRPRRRERLAFRRVARPARRRS
ncbi:MAG: hypothetical protein M3167_06575 [Acidobacteriota bacterium]|nr:hypothetical protein [Acidobacteriota bacterium]